MEKILCLNPGIRAAGAGAFAENIRMTGIAFACLSIGTLLRIGDNALLRVSQIGKKCHSACTIRSMIGACIMPEEGIFAEVLRGGEVRAGDEVKTEKVL
jgi:MOSC domain-containing protein YiiM